MASAGRVLPLPKGAYSSSTTYHLLDFVSYQGSTYICKQTSTGNAPTNTTYWQIMAQGTESASVAGNYYGTCSTGASTSAKIVSIPATENFVLQVGDIIGIKFDNTNTANNPSLNVNNSGAKPIYYNNSAVSTSNLWASGEANRVTIFMYDGTNWIWMGHDVDIDTDTLSDLKDTTISSASNGQVLMYDGTSNKWKNQTPTTTLAGLSDTQISSATDGQVLKYNSTSQKWVNGEDKGGILPHLIVISETGSTVTATKGQTVITATETSTGHFECDLTELGTWTIDAILGGDDAQVSLVVDTVKVYTVDDSHFHATVTVKYPDGATCRLQSADETLYATSSPYTFTVHHAETYTITITYNQRIYTDTVTFTTEGQSFSKALPSPSEVDANDINMWLWYGDVSGTFSSLSEILANNSALATLMTSHDAVDYLVRSTDWIINKGLVPIMTSDTTPSGVASAGNVYGPNNAYRAFDDDDTTYWYTNVTDSTSWIQYEFENPVCVKRFKALIALPSANTNYCPSGYTLSASNDGVNFTTLKTESITKVTSSFELDVSFENPNLFKYYRILVSNSSSGYGIGQWNRLQFYTDEKGITESQSAMSYIGLNNYCTNTLLADSDWRDGIANSEYIDSVMNVKVPTMTSDTTPSGTVFYTSQLGTYSGKNWSLWTAFDGDKTKTNGWNPLGTDNVERGGYQFTSQKVIKIIHFMFKVGGTNSGTNNLSIKFIGSNDGTNWVDLTDAITISGNYDGKISIPNNVQYNRYAIIKVTGKINSSTGNWYYVPYIQFYGREDA